MIYKYLISVRTGLIVLCFFWLPLLIKANNLVPNPGFEENTGCPTGQSQLRLVSSWFEHFSTTDYFHACNPSQFVYDKRAASARTGAGHIGIFTYQSPYTNVREYPQCKLKEALQAGECYYFEMYVKPSEASSLATEEIGVYFSKGEVTGNQGIYPHTPQVTSPPGISLNNLTKWTKISGVYTAAGGEDHLVIGQFKTDAQTKFTPLPGREDSYYFVDDVLLVPYSATVQPTVIEEKLRTGPVCTNGAVTLHVLGGHKTLRWQDGSTERAFDVTQSGIYWVEVIKGNCSIRDSITILFPEVYLGPPDTVLCNQKSLLLNAYAPNATYLWSGNNQQPTLEVTRSDTYRGFVTDTITGCRALAEISVYFKECTRDLFIPNVITPNGDGLNETFFIRDLTDNWSLDIANRWGRSIYRTTSYRNDWNGNGYANGECFYVLNNQITHQTYRGILNILR